MKTMKKMLVKDKASKPLAESSKSSKSSKGAYGALNTEASTKSESPSKPLAKSSKSTKVAYGALNAEPSTKSEVGSESSTPRKNTGRMTEKMQEKLRSNYIEYAIEAVVVIALIAVAMPVFLPRIRLGGVLIILFFCLLFHRILGFLVAFAIRMLMRKSGEGTFNIHIAWIAFRFGFDMNQIEIHGIEWRNPPFYVNTPYLFRVECIILTLNLFSIVKWLSRGTAIHIPMIKVDHLHLHIEKATKEEVEMARQAGYLKSHEEMHKEALEFDKEHDEKLMSEIAVLRTKLDTKTFAEGETESKVKALIAKKEKEINDPLLMKTQISENVSNIFAAIGARYPADEATFFSDLIDAIDDASTGKQNVFRGLGDKLAKFRPDKAFVEGYHAFEGMFSKKSDEKDELDKVAMASLKTTPEMRAIAPASHSSCSCGGENGCFGNAGLCGPRATYDVADDNKDNRKNKKFQKGFGVPIRFEIDELHLSRVAIDAADFLNATHGLSAYKAAEIKVNLSMYRDSLCSRDRKGKRIGAYIDELAFRIINGLVARLMLENTSAFMALVGGALVNNTAHSVVAGFEKTENFFETIGSTVAEPFNYAARKLSEPLKG